MQIQVKCKRRRGQGKREERVRYAIFFNQTDEHEALDLYGISFDDSFKFQVKVSTWKLLNYSLKLIQLTFRICSQNTKL